MKLPDVFQFRIKDEPGYTHIGKVKDGVCKVAWARGFERYYMDKTNTVMFPHEEWSFSDVAHQFSSRRWMLVDEKKAEQKSLLPDEFYFCLTRWPDEKYLMKKVDGNYKCYESDGSGKGADWKQYLIEEYIADGSWKMLDKKPLTAEQQRANKEYSEQIAQLNSSIRISEQNVEHQLRLQASYKERIEILNSKIVEET